MVMFEEPDTGTILVQTGSESDEKKLQDWASKHDPVCK